jgi:hypothetical protein
MVSVTICSPGSVIGEQWRDLVSRAPSNVFMDPAALTAASVTDFAKIYLLLAWDEAQTPGKLVGLWALRVRKIAPFWPAVLEALPYDYAFLSTPVIDPVLVDDVVCAFFAAIEKNPELPRVISLQSLNAESAAMDAMLKALRAHGRYLKLSDHERPFATRNFGVKRSGSTRKKLRQDLNRLSALGTADFLNDRAPGAVKDAFETFLALEAASWKGTRGTALLCDSSHAAFVRRLVGDLGEQGKASVALLRLDGRVIAAQVLMYCGSTAYTWKTAFDAEYAKYSPGALLIDKITDELFAGTEINAIDSCAAEDSFMGQLWAGRRKMVDLLTDVGSGRSPVFAMEAGRLLGYRRLREMRNRLRAAASTARPKKMPIAVGA